MLTSDDVRRRLKSTVLSNGATDIVMPPESSGWPAPLLEQLSGSLTPAGVLIPIVERGDELSLLLTQRSQELKHHAGQVSFPGGRMEKRDATIVATALRETHEEVGIDPRQISIVGYLNTLPTGTGYAVTPVVGLIEGEPELDIDHSEVEYTFEVPLAFLLDSRNDRLIERSVGGYDLVLAEFHWQNERIWGATAHIVLMLRKALLNK